jgi:hypothetical protein
MDACAGSVRPRTDGQSPIGYGRAMFLLRALASSMLASLLLPLNTHAQAYYAGWPVSRIEAFEVSTVRHLVPGAVLHFSVFGLPEGQAAIRMTGANRPLHLQEVDAGHYVGDYTLGPEDRITQTSQVTVALRSIMGMASVQLDGTLNSGEEEMRRAPHEPPFPRLGHLQIIPAIAPASGTRLKFLLDGTPEGEASISISGLGPTILLSEIYGSGHYFGTYTLRDYDRVTAFSVVSTALRVANQINRVSLGQYFQQVTAPMPLLSDKTAPFPRTVAQGIGMP